MKALSLKLWLYLWCNVFLLVLCHYFGIFDLLLRYDFTFISFGIIGIMMLDMIYLTISVWKGQTIDLENHWAVKDLLLAMGLTGTLIGLIYVFTPLGGVDTSDLAAMKGLVVHVAVGVGTKLWTSLAGIICSNILMIFLLMIQSYQQELRN